MQKIKKSIALCAFALLTLAFTSCGRQNQEVTIDSQEFSLEVANTNIQREKGLSQIESLDKNKGMLFIFDKKGNLDFWMKETLIPLQILFINGCEIVDVQEMAVEKDPANPIDHYISKSPADKAIELNAQSIPKDLIGQTIKELCNP